MSHNTLAPPLPQPAMTDALQALRHATAERHAQLDSGLPIARADANLADYQNHVHALAAWLQALWPALLALQACAPRFGFAPAARLSALREDLAHMDEQATLPWPQPSATTAQCLEQALARHPGQADAVRWGMAYVVEGSQLGGQVLHRGLAPRLAPHPLRYLQGDGAGTGARWKAFMALLRTHVASPPAIAAACDGALAAFQGLQAHFDTMDATQGTPA
ncbi:biliverdin-producing heme oxygenase [Acidovorax sp.]|uniref:biliverdin-producing heme oxygenase n=1 Tax=Acidovorax sp. TaxID=1872122 RepID=UPI003CFC8ADC